MEVLPKGVVRNHGALYWISTDPATKKQTWHRLGSTWSEAEPKYRQLVVKTRKPGYAGRVLYEAGEGPIPERFLQEMLKNARKNAKSRGLEFTLTLDDAKVLAERCGGRCELTGLQFQYGQAEEMRGKEGRRRRVWAPSFDRVDSRAGYTPRNLRIVCFAVNAARQEFGDEILLKVAHGLVKHNSPRLISSANRAATSIKRRINDPSIFGTAKADLSTGAASGPIPGAGC